MTQEPKKRPSNTPHPEKFDENKFLMYTYYNGEFTDNLFENHFLLTASNVNFSTTLFMCKNCQGMMNFTEMLIHECTECNICMDTMKKRVRCSQCSGTMCGACASKLQKCPFCRMSLALLPAPLPIGTEEEEGEVPVWVEDEFRRVTEEVGF